MGESPATLNDRYEQLRRFVTVGGETPPPGLAVLRYQGLRGWIAQVTTTPQDTPRSALKAVSPLATPDTVAIRSPLLDLCTDLLIATLIPKKEEASCSRPTRASFNRPI